jgi:uncharacterized membrane protein
MGGNTVSHDSYSVDTENGFPWRVLLANILVWLLPVGVYGVYLQLPAKSSGVVPMLLLLALTCMVPVAALVLYLIDKRRENGYIAVWGYK